MSAVFSMTWKSTAAASGLMIVGTWLASLTPVGQPRQPESQVPSVARTEEAGAEIQREAERLHARMQVVAAYRTPARNPFRFGVSKPPQRTGTHREAPMTGDAVAPVEVPQAPTLLLMLAGIAEDVVGNEVVRTAIISSPDNVHLVKNGDTLAGIYRVETVGADAVELKRLDDGSTVRLSLRP